MGKCRAPPLAAQPFQLGPRWQQCPANNNRAILFSMEWMHRHYEKFAAKFNLDGAICYLLAYAFLLFLGVLELRLASRTADKFYEYAGTITVVLGVFGIFHAWQVIRAVARQLSGSLHP